MGDAMREDSGKAVLASVTFLPIPSQEPVLCSKMTQLPEGWDRAADRLPSGLSAWGPGSGQVEPGCGSLIPWDSSLGDLEPIV